MKADFYIGLGEDARWLGSISDHGAPCDVDNGYDLFNTSGANDDYDERSFADAVSSIVAADGGHWAESGASWPWVYPTSTGTDYTYAWNNGCIHVFERGYMVAQHYPNGARRASTFPLMK